MERTGGYFLRTVEVDTNQLIVSGLSIVPDRPLLLEQPETPSLEKLHQFAEPQSISPFPVYRRARFTVFEGNYLPWGFPI